MYIQKPMQKFILRLMIKFMKVHLIPHTTKSGPKFTIKITTQTMVQIIQLIIQQCMQSYGKKIMELTTLRYV